MRVAATACCLVSCCLADWQPCHGQASERQLLAAAIEAIGGRAAIEARPAMTWLERGTYYSAGGQLPYRGRLAVQWPDRYRMQIDGAYTLVLRGQQCWLRGPGVATTQTMSGAQLAEQLEGHYGGWITTLVPLLDEDRFELEGTGQRMLGDRPVEGLRVRAEGHRDVELLFDSRTHLLVASLHDVRSEEDDGQLVRQRVEYLGYQDFDGLQVPLRFRIYRQDELFVQGQMSDVELAAQLPERLFERP